MKTLAGNWEGKHEMGGKSMTLKVNYKVSSAGSAVVETSFPGMPNEMVSVYTEVNGKVNMTHYCALQNQPTLKLQDSKIKIQSNSNGLSLKMEKQPRKILLFYPE